MDMVERLGRLHLQGHKSLWVGINPPNHRQGHTELGREAESPKVPGLVKGEAGFRPPPGSGSALQCCLP